MKPNTYLVGLIDSNIPETLAWRLRAAEQLGDAFNVRNPMAVAPNPVDGGITGIDMSDGAMVYLDYNFVATSRVIVANLNNYGCQRQMVGTPFELAWAWQLRIPVVGICRISDAPGSHAYVMRRHSFMTQAVSQFFECEYDAYDFVKKYYTYA